MAEGVKFLTGGIDKLSNKKTDGTLEVPIEPGSVYFALSDDHEYGYIVYDVSPTERRVMSTKAKLAGSVEQKLYIGEHEYDGSEEVHVPIYNGENDGVDDTMGTHSELWTFVLDDGTVVTKTMVVM